MTDENTSCPKRQTFWRRLMGSTGAGILALTYFPTVTILVIHMADTHVWSGLWHTLFGLGGAIVAATLLWDLLPMITEVLRWLVRDALPGYADWLCDRDQK